ncbi:BTB/POZ domain-containing protein At1g04390-like [Henckelia pumila]|uniref:BTB/POZ domain-containing protein At1g04390-like n=1 Tax=Henckelia pumila TaxID=405737 RepID=UPI003C6E2FC2
MGRRKCRKLEYLLQLGNKGVPKWGTPMPRFDLAFLPAELDSQKIVVKSKRTKSGSWNCESCSKSIPHLHVPKDVLKLSSDYFDNFFGSCMKDSCRKTSKASVSWETLEKIGPWLYLEPLSAPNLGCLCANMDPAEKLKEVGVYL